MEKRFLKIGGALRWFLLLCVTFGVCVSSFWIYLYTHREQFFSQALTSVFPTSHHTFSDIEVAFTPNGLVVSLKQLQLSDGDRGTFFDARTLSATVSTSNFLKWACLPTTSPLNISSVSLRIERADQEKMVQNSVAAVPALSFKLEKLVVSFKEGLMTSSPEAVYTLVDLLEQATTLASKTHSE